MLKPVIQGANHGVNHKTSLHGFSIYWSKVVQTIFVAFPWEVASTGPEGFMFCVCIFMTKAYEG